MEFKENELKLLQDNLKLAKEADRLWHETYPDLSVDLYDVTDEENFHFLILSALEDQHNKLKESISTRKKLLGYKTKK